MTKLSVLAIILFSIITHSKSQDTPGSNGTDPTIYRGSQQYKYHGCYNETTQIQDSAEERALTGGSHLVKPGKMTVPMCLEFCVSNGTQYQYAGLEWSRECWCSPYLSSLSEKLNDGDCVNPCEGNSSQVCGGSLRLSVYELSKGGDASNGVPMKQASGGMLVISVIFGLSLLAV